MRARCSAPAQGHWSTSRHFSTVSATSAVPPSPKVTVGQYGWPARHTPRPSRRPPRSLAGTCIAAAPLGERQGDQPCACGRRPSSQRPAGWTGRAGWTVARIKICLQGVLPPFAGKHPNALQPVDAGLCRRLHRRRQAGEIARCPRTCRGRRRSSRRTRNASRAGPAGRRPWPRRQRTQPGAGRR